MKKIFDWLFSLLWPNKSLNPSHNHFQAKFSDRKPHELPESEKTEKLGNTFTRKISDQLLSQISEPESLQKVISDAIHHTSLDEEEQKFQERLDEALAIATSKTPLIQDQMKSSAISALIGEQESLVLIRLMRWKNGVQCPYCHSFHIKILDAIKHQYRCLDCEESGHQSIFDVLTNYFPKNGDWHSARTWILIQYLKIFMPLSKIAKVLGISFEEAMRIISMVQPTEHESKKELKKTTSRTSS